MYIKHEEMNNGGDMNESTTGSEEQMNEGGHARAGAGKKHEQAADANGWEDVSRQEDVSVGERRASGRHERAEDVSGREVSW